MFKLSIIGIELTNNIKEIIYRLNFISNLKQISGLCLLTDESISKNCIDSVVDYIRQNANLAKIAISVDIYLNNFNNPYLENNRNLLNISNQIRFHITSKNYTKCVEHFLSYITQLYPRKNICLLYIIDKYIVEDLNLFTCLTYVLNYEKLYLNYVPVTHGEYKIDINSYYKLAKRISEVKNHYYTKIYGDFPEGGAVYSGCKGVCPAKIYQINIDRNGYVTPCFFSSKRLFELSERIESLFSDYIENIRKTSECKNCISFGTCYGGCLNGYNDEDDYSIYCYKRLSNNLN